MHGATGLLAASAECYQEFHASGQQPLSASAISPRQVVPRSTPSGKGSPMDQNGETAPLSQSESQAKPPEKRRRRLIVTLLLVFASGAVWWHWPRGDARFVGKWDSRTGLFVVSHIEYEFLPNGWGGKTELNFADAPQKFRWWVEDNCLILERHHFLESPRFWGTEAFYRVGLFKFASWINPRELPARERLPLKDIAFDEFSVEDYDGLAGSHWTMTRKFKRIPE